MFRYKGYSLSKDLPLLLGVFFLVPYYTLLLKLYPIGKIISSCQRVPVNLRNRKKLTASEKVELHKVYRAATFFLSRLWRSDRPCLRRTLILYRWCCRRSIEARIIIGVSKNNQELKSHAWLEINRIPFKETSEQLGAYTPILEG